MAQNPSPINAQSHMLLTMSNNSPASSSLDLDAIDQDLTDVETALQRLDAGTYFVDEITGAPLSQEMLNANPTARRA
jgi:RNA polymerase-binding transcription factor DksA